MDEWVYSQSAGFIVGTLFVLFIVAWELGFRLGLKVSKSDQALVGDSQALAIEAAILTLFGLLLGFTFSMSSNRYESRRETTLKESNAIGTAYLRADLFPGTERKLLRQALRNYLKSRFEFYQAPFGGPLLSQANEKADRFQREAWEIAVRESKLHPSPINALVINSLNEMIDLREVQQVVFENVVPQTVILFLFVLSFLVVGIIGYMNGMHNARRLSPSVIFVVVVTLTLFLVIDLDRPRRGLIRLGHESLIRLHESFENSSASD